MAAKQTQMFECKKCGYESLRWAGKCPGCGEWNTFSEKELDEDPGEKSGPGNKKVKPAKVTDFGSKSKANSKRKRKKERMSTGFREVDRVLGGGLVGGEVVVLSGEPGIGKSTLLTQICVKLSQSNEVFYVSGEESADQLETRVSRISKSSKSSESKKSSLENFKITEDTDVDRVIASIEKNKPDLVVIDSIQSVSTQDSRGFSGSISQVRECGQRLTRCAKQLGIPTIIVGQVTKEGVVAGPKVLEHIVDAVLYFEGDEFGLYRILRSIKNRFGATDEVGMFEMSSGGLVEIDDPTGVMLEADGKKRKPQSGVALCAVFKGSRVLIVEVQALTSGAGFGSPRRIPTGLKKSRLEMLCAVLTRRAGINLSDDDVFVNVMGGLHLDDPSIDLAVCAAIASAKKDKPVDPKKVFVGEVGLSGEIRKVAFQEKIETEVKRRGLLISGGKSKARDRLRGVIKSVVA